MDEVRGDLCLFCNDTRVWAGPEERDQPDPCPHCSDPACVRSEVASGRPLDGPSSAFDEVMRVLPALTAAERQRLYEWLHRAYDCRLYPCDS